MSINIFSWQTASGQVTLEGGTQWLALISNTKFHTLIWTYALTHQTILQLENRFYLFFGQMCQLYICTASYKHSLYMLDMHSHTVKHTYRHVQVCAPLCACTMHIHRPYVHMPLCHRVKGGQGGVSIFPGPFFGDNDGHFFFSVTDDRQN